MVPDGDHHRGSRGPQKAGRFSFRAAGLNPAGLRAIGERVTKLGKSGRLGPLALVVKLELALNAVILFSQHARGDRNLRIFRKLALARK